MGEHIAGLSDTWTVSAAPVLSVVVPTFNERANLPELIERISTVLTGVAWEIIIVDDDSPDGTAALAKSLAATDPRIRCLRRVGRRGLAGACIEGMLASSAPFVAVIDGDLQHDERLLAPMLARLQQGDIELAVGSRFVAGGAAASGFSHLRQVISRAGRWLADQVLGSHVSDTMSGFFMLRREIVERVARELCADGFKILADILATGGKTMRVEEFGYEFRARKAGESKLDTRVVLDFLGLMLNKMTGGLLPVTFVGFALVGLLGLVVHMLVLRAGLGASLPFMLAQSLATVIAMVFNFAVNNRTTHAHARLRGRAWWRGLFLFCGICTLSAFANVGVASWVFLEGQSWFIAGLAGIIMAASWNYAVSTKLVWRR